MRELVLADVHADIDALNLVLDVEKYDRILFLGDFLGRGQFPNEVVKRLFSKNITAIAGNHDLVALGKEPIERVGGDYALRDNLEWTKRELSKASKDKLNKLKSTLIDKDNKRVLVHASPWNPTWGDLRSDFPLSIKMTRPDHYYLVGHSHVPAVFYSGRRIVGHPGLEIDLTDPTLRFLNPGSISRPREGSGLSYVIIEDNEKATFCGVTPD